MYPIQSNSWPISATTTTTRRDAIYWNSGFVGGAAVGRKLESFLLLIDHVAGYDIVGILITIGKD